MANVSDKKITRFIELSLGFKNQGGDAARQFADITAQAKAFIAANPAASIEDVAEAIRILGSNYRTTNPLMVKFIKGQQEAGNAAHQWAAALTKVQQGAVGLMRPFQGLAALVGGEAIGFGAGIKWVVAYQKQMLGLSAQMSKYGVGLGEISKKISDVGKTTGLTMKETADLYSLYEKGFPFNSLENGAKIFNNIKAAVGGNSEAMQAMLQDLQGIIEKFPELEDGITNLSDNNRKLLESQSRLAFMTGKMSLAEHKRFQDYIRGGKQQLTADQEHRKQMQEQIDAMNKLRQVFEKIAQDIGRTLLPMMQELSSWVQKIYPKIQPWIPTLAKAGLVLAGIVGSLKLISGIVNGIQLAKMFKDLPGMGVIKSMFSGPGGGGAGGWGNKAVSVGMQSPAAWMKGAGGAVSGFVAGKAVDYGYEALTGKELSQDHGMRAVGGEVAKTGAQIGAGFATGGVPGAIGAGLMSILENIYHLLQAWYGDKNSIKTIRADVQAANKHVNAMDNKSIDKMKDQLAHETDPFKKAQLEQTIQSMELLKKAHKEDRDKSQRSSGYGAATYRTAMNFGSYLSPADNAARLAGIDPIEEREKAEDKLGLGASSSDKAKDFYKQSHDIAVRQQQQRDANDKAKIQNALGGTNIKLDDAQFQELFKAMDQARDGATDKLMKTGVNARKAGDVGALWEQGSGKEFNDLVRQAAAGLSGQKYTPGEKTAEETARSGVAASKANEQVNAYGAQSLAKLDKNDLVGAMKEYRSILDVMDKSEVQNTLHADTRNEAVLKQYGVDTSKVVGANSQETFAARGETYKQLENAQGGISKDMAALDKKRDAGGNLQGDDAKKYDELKAANDAINNQLEERGKMFDQQLPKLQMLDAAFNAHAKSVSATNELLQAQKEYVNAIVSTAQTTGNIDFGNIQKNTADSISYLKQYNAGLRQQIDLEQEQLRVEADERAATMKKNAADAANYRKDTKSDGTKKTDEEKKDGNDKADALERSNKLLEIEDKRGVLINQANAERLKQLAQADTLQKQIVEALQQQLDLNKANVDYAAANVSKAEALIDIYDNMGAGLKASAQMRMDAANLMGRQISEERKNLEMINATIQQGVPAMAEEVGKEQAFKGKPREEIIAEAKKRLISLDTARVQKETTILNLVQKQAQMTKAIRDGYVSAIMAMTAGSGIFTKIMITQDKNLGVGVKYMNVLQSKTAGGIGGGKTEAARYTLGGIVDNDRTKGYKDWSGMYSNNNDVEQIQREALARTQGLAGNIVAQNTGAFGAPNNAGAALQASAQGNQQFPPAQPGVNTGGAITNIGPATAPNSGTVAPGQAVQPAAPVTPASQPMEGTTLLKQINDTETETLNVLRRIEAKIGGGTTPIATHRDGGVVGRFRDGGMIGLYRDGGGVSGLTNGESEKGDQYQIGVAGGEVIMNKRQWPRVASALGMSPDEFANMVQAKDYTRLPDAKMRDGGLVVGKYADGGGPVGGTPQPEQDRLAAKQIEFIYDGKHETPTIDNKDPQKMVVHVKQGTKFSEKKFTESYTNRLDELRKAREDARSKPDAGAYMAMYGVEEDVSFGNKVITPANPQNANAAVGPAQPAQQPQQTPAQPTVVDKVESAIGSAVDKGKSVLTQIGNQFQTNSAQQLKELPGKIALLKQQIAAMVPTMEEEAKAYKAIINKTDGHWDGARISDRTIEDSFPMFKSLNENVGWFGSYQISPSEYRQMRNLSDQYNTQKTGRAEMQKQLELYEQQLGNLTQLGKALPQAVTAPVAPANKPQAQQTPAQPAAPVPAATPAATPQAQPVDKPLSDDSTSAPITGKTLADTLKDQPAAPVGPAKPTDTPHHKDLTPRPRADHAAMPPATSDQTAAPTPSSAADQSPPPTPAKMVDGYPVDEKGNRISRRGWIYTRGPDGLRWYNPDEVAIVKSEKPYDWSKHKYIGESGKPTKGTPKEIEKALVHPNRKLRERYETTKNYDVGIGAAHYMQEKEREERKKHTEYVKYMAEQQAKDSAFGSKGFDYDLFYAKADKQLGGTFRDGGLIPHFATGGVVPNMGEAQKEALKALGIGSQVGGDKTLVLATPGEKFMPQSTGPIMPASVDRVLPQQSQPSMPQQDSSSSTPQLVQPIININGVKVDYGDLNKFGGVVQGKIDAALDDVLQQMSGRRSTLPRGN